MECTKCGMPAPVLNTLDDKTRVCNSCLLTFYYTCAECGELLDVFDVESFKLEDGRTVCANCRTKLNEE